MLSFQEDRNGCEIVTFLIMYNSAGQVTWLFLTCNLMSTSSKCGLWARTVLNFCLSRKENSLQLSKDRSVSFASGPCQGTKFEGHFIFALESRRQRRCFPWPTTESRCVAFFSDECVKESRFHEQKMFAEFSEFSTYKMPPLGWKK